MSATESIDELRDRLRAEGRFWGDCRGCGRPLDRHSRRKIPNTGTDEYNCPDTPRLRFESATMPELDYNPQRGLHRP